MTTARGRTRLVVAKPNLRGFHGLTLDAFGALLEGGPLDLPESYVRVLADRGSAPDRGKLGELWRSTFRKHLRTEPFVSFRDVHRRALQDLLGAGGNAVRIDEVVDEIMDSYRRVRAYPEVPAVLAELEREVAVAIVSNMETGLLLEALHRNGLEITFVITSEEEQRYKPSVSLFQRAIRYLGLPPQHVLHAGDSYAEDVVGATSSGLGSLLIRRPNGRQEPQGEAKRVVHDLREVRDFIHESWEK